MLLIFLKEKERGEGFFHSEDKRESSIIKDPLILQNKIIKDKQNAYIVLLISLYENHATNSVI